MIVIDYADKRPIYEQIVERFAKLIASGVLEADEKMPSVRSLAVELSINPNTIQKAYSELERRGYIYTIKGRGNFVKDNPDLRDAEIAGKLDELHSLVEHCREIGIEKKQLLETVENVYREDKS